MESALNLAKLLNAMVRISRVYSSRLILKSFVGLWTFILLGSCATMSQHQFAEPAGGWQTRAGQLLVRSANATVIGDVIVRFSESGDFDLNFSKGPGLTLLAIREDSSFAEVKGALAQRGWSGQIERAPAPLRSWLQLRNKFVHGQGGKSFRYQSGTETFDFRF